MVKIITIRLFLLYRPALVFVIGASLILMNVNRCPLHCVEGGHSAVFTSCLESAACFVYSGVGVTCCPASCSFVLEWHEETKDICNCEPTFTFLNSFIYISSPITIFNMMSFKRALCVRSCLSSFDIKLIIIKT